MGRTGTEVSKAAADIIVTDDNFAAIVAAVEEGRCVHDNIGKTLGFLLAGNAAELLVVLAASVAGWPLPLLPAHLLWINLVTDGLPALVLATEGPEPGTLTRPPRPAAAPLLDRRRVALIVLAGCLTAGVSFAVFTVHLAAGAELARARDAAFTVLVVAELARALGARNDRLALWQMGWVGSARLLGVVVAGVSLQIAVHHLEPFRTVLSLTPVDLVDCLGWIALGLVPLVALEARKALARWKGERT
jgi:Ca2+-transporting ATPase